MFKNRSLRTKLFFQVTLVVVASFIVATWIVSFRSVQLAQDDAYKLTEEMAEKYSYEIKSELQAARVTSESLMTVLKTLIERDDADRDTFNAILQNSLRQKEYIISFCVAFEPNKLDGKDAEYAGQYPLYDETGRYAPYWNMVNGELNVEPLSDFDEDDWYAGARDSGKEYITDPFFYEVQGAPVLMTSLVFPIMINGEFIGIVSSDMALDSMQDMVSHVNTSGLGEFTEIYSNSGLVVAHPDNNYFNKSVYATSAYNMLITEPSKAKEASAIANHYMENLPPADDIAEASMEEYDSANAFIESLESYAQNPNNASLDLSLLTDDLAKALLTLDEGRMKVADEATSAIANGESYTATEDGYYKVYMPIRFSEVTNPWSVAVCVPMTEVMKVANDIQRFVLIICIISIVVIALILFMMSNSITKPILNLANAAGQFGEGNFDVKLPPAKGYNEIGILSNAFNGMAERINDLIHSLQNNAKELKDKNAHLNYLNETLVATNHVSETILNLEHQQFHDVLDQSLQILGDSVHADGVSIWKNEKHNDNRIFSRVISLWFADETKKKTDTDILIDLDMHLPGWDDPEIRKDSIGSDAITGSEKLMSLDIFHNCKSVLLIPLMLHDSYWGFLVFSYREESYQLKCDESEILRSSGMTIASAILQNETSESLKEAEEMASTDPLTGLTNRNGFLMKAPAVYAECRADKEPLTLLFFDLDHFKLVNDQYGHPFGDEVLKAFSEIIKKETGEDDVSCRYGGEEFILLLCDTDRDTGNSTSERILDSVRNTTFTSQPDFSFTVSIGMVVGVPGMHDTLNGYIQKADNALYTAKKNGRDQVVIFTDPER